MEKKLKLPIGIENFSELRKRNYYYVDKTELIEQVLEDGSQVILFTRPRRFGKSLNMSMLKSFFEKETDPALFEGLYIAQNIELCRQYMGQYPVISISLKGVDSNSYEGAYKLLVQSICDEIERFQFLIESNELTQIDKKRYFELIDRKMEPDTLAVSLKGLTLLLEKHYHQKVVVLIDEYDVPLAKAYENGYYDEMILLIRNLFGNVLKTNDSLAFAVLTGCLRIAKESIFTGLNNFKVYSITDDEFDETFGFTNKEVMEMLQYYGLSDRFDEVKEWYDGYRFGNADVPWFSCGILTAGCPYLAADFYYIVTVSFFFQQAGNHIDAISFGDSRKIQADAVICFGQTFEVGGKDKPVEAGICQCLLYFFGIGRLSRFVDAKPPEVYQTADGGVKSSAAFPVDVSCIFQQIRHFGG